MTKKPIFFTVLKKKFHPSQTLCKQKSSEMIQVNVPIFFYFAEIPKLTEIWPKNRFYSHTLCVWAGLSVTSNIFLAGPSFMEVILHQNIENKKVPK